MVAMLAKYGVVTVVLGAVAWQTFLKTILFNTVGVGRHMQPVSDFPYQCRRIHDPRLQACEDMWLSEETRQLFLACSEPLARQHWMPNFDRFNASGRSFTDAIIAMDIDKPRGDSFEYRVLQTPAFTSGDGYLNLVGLTGQDTKSGISIALVNARPHFDATTGSLLDNEKLGGDHRIEFFETDARATELRHARTYGHAEIRTPNNIALASSSGFYITNDHGTAKAGWRFAIAPYVGNGDVTYCSTQDTKTPDCKVVSTGHHFPNGLLLSRGDDDKTRRLYVPSAFLGGITVYKMTENREIQKTGHIDVPYPIDNLSEDRNGDIWFPGFPKASQVLESYNDPFNFVSASTIFRVKRRGDEDEWEWEKILEDASGEVLPGATTVIHDVKTGRLFVSGVISPFITVCEKIQ